MADNNRKVIADPNWYVGETTTNALTAIKAVTDTLVSNVNIPQFTGTVYYVDAARPDDTGDGLTPATAKKTITAAEALLTAGDAIKIGAGTYAEAVTLNVASCELWFEIGAVIAPGAGTPLTISANYCKVICDGGALFLTPVAGGTGMVISGANCYVHDVRVNCASIADLGYDITGNGCVLDHCRCADPLVAAFKIQGDKIALYDCCTGGQAANTSIGFWVTNTADQFRLIGCGSQGHISGSFVIDTGCTNGCVRDCDSGVGDGRWSDVDHSTNFAGFHYETEKNKVVTFAGGGLTTFNLFQVTGAVRIEDVYGVVRTQIENLASTAYLQLYSTGGTADVTDAPGTNIANAVVGSMLMREEDSTNALTLASAATPAIVESTTWQDPKVPIDLIADADQTTYLRLVISAALASGAIRWHCHFTPLSDDGWLTTV